MSMEFHVVLVLLAIVILIAIALSMFYVAMRNPSSTIFDYVAIGVGFVFCLIAVLAFTAEGTF